MAVVLPNGRQFYTSNAGLPLVGGKVFTYDTGTNNPRQTTSDAAGLVPNANPVILDARGEATIFWSGAYRVVVQDSLGNIVIPAIDGISTNFLPSGSLVPTSDNAFSLGSPTFSWANLYLGANHAPVLDTVTGNIGYYARTLAEIAAAVTPTNFSYPPGHVYRYGTNVTPGTTDMTAAFQNASLVSLNPYAPNDTYKITGTITIRAGQSWRLDNPTINITGNTIVFSAADQINDWRIFGGCTVVGDNTTGGALAGTGKALYCGGCNRYYVENIVSKNIKGIGIYVDAGTFVDPLGDQGKFVACTSDSCTTGFQTIPGTAGEYCIFEGCIATRCNVGTDLSAGNTLWIGGNIEGNTNGVNLSSGANSAHGMFIGTNINHNTAFAVHTLGVLNGHTFVGCHIYSGSIWFESSKGVIFQDCFVDAAAYYFDGSEGCGFIDCLMPLGDTNNINNDFNAHPSFPIWRNCKTLIGKTFPLTSAVNANIEGIRVIATSPGIAISAANLLAGVTILFTDAANQAANQPANTLYDGYVAATGIFTNTGHGTGFLKISAQIALTHNAADSALGIFGTIQVNGAGTERYLVRTELTTTTIIFSFDGFIAVNAGDTIRFRLGSNALLANAVTVAIADTRVLVEGL